MTTSRWWVFCALLPLALEGRAAAGGFFVPGAGPAAQGRAGAYVARADDPTAITHNPAGLAKLDGTHLYVGANFLRYVLSYQRAGVYEPALGDEPLPYEGQPFPKVENNGDAAIGFLGFQALPTFALSTDLGHPEWPVRFGVGLFSPQAFPTRSFEAQVLTDNGELAPSPQRYDVLEQEVIISSPSLVLAYSPLENLDIALRGSWAFAELSGSKTVWTLENYEEDPGQDSTFSLEGARDNFIPMFGLGLQYRPSPSFEIGAAWNSQGHIRAEGTGSSVIGGGSVFGDSVQVIPRPDSQTECATGGQPGALKACATIDMAQSATLGGRWILRDASGRERADLELDVKWEDWSASTKSQVQVDGIINVSGTRLESLGNPHGFQDVISTRLGGGYRVDMAGGTLEFKGGLAYDTKTAPDSWTRVDQDNKQRATFATGLAFERGRYRFDLGLGAVWEPDVTVEPCKPPFGPSGDDEGCLASGMVPVDERSGPSPGQPLFDDGEQKESPFNAGLYESGYLMFATGVRMIF